MKALNVHIYPSIIVQESRLFKVTATLIQQRFVKRIIIVGKSGPNIPFHTEIDKDRTIERFPMSQARGSLLSRSIRFIIWSLRVFTRFRSDKIDMVNCHSLSVLPLCLALKVWHRSILIYEPHELETETSQMCGFKKRISKVIEGILIKHVNWTILVSDSIETWYRKHYKLVNTSVVLNCPPRLPVCASRYFYECFGVPMHTPIFLYQGILCEGRGIELMVDAFGAMPDEAALVLMGYGELFEWAETYSKQFKNVYVHHAVLPSELHAMTCSADFALSLIEPLSLSYEYCMPNKLFEYIMGGVPTLVSNTVEQRKVVQQFGIGEVATALTPDAIRAAARKLLSSDRSNFKAGLEQASQEYCWERQEIILRHVYNQISLQKAS
jgi:glycosyltransferase involved in cell wall biosynthesis